MSNPLNILSFIIISLSWGGSFLAIQIAISHFPSDFSAFLRSLTGFILVALFLLLKRSGIKKSKVWLQSMGAGLFTMGFAWVFLFWGERYVSPAMGAILNGTVPIFITLLTPIMTPFDKLSWNKWVGVLIGFTGVVVIFAPELSWNVSIYLKGLLAILMMAVCYAIGVLWTRRLSNKVDNSTNLFYQCIGSMVLLLSLSSIFELPYQPIHWSWPAVLAILYLGSFSTALSWLLFFRLARHVGSVSASATTYCVPIVAILLDIVFRHQWPKTNQIVGVCIILTAVFLINWKVKKKSRSQDALYPAI